MIARNSQSQPKLRRQKCSGRPDRAYVVWHGQRIYLGRWGSVEAHAKYDRIIAEQQLGSESTPVTGTDITVAELAVQYLRHCDSYYRDSNEDDNIKLALRPVVALYGDVPASQFGPKALKACRDRLVEQGNSRRYINKHVVRIRGAFRWAVAEELVPASVYDALRAVAGLKRGRCDARETEPVLPVEGARSAQDEAVSEGHVEDNCRRGRPEAADESDALLHDRCMDTIGECGVARLRQSPRLDGPGPSATKRSL